jgi:hypothetical protein
MNEVLIKKYEKLIDNLNLEKVVLASAIENNNIITLNIMGGLRGKGTWTLYIKQLETIIKKFDNSYVISLDYDEEIDIWNLILGIK